jgi:hypothetical protein
VDVAADASLPVALAAGAALDMANVTQVRDGLVAHGHATGDEIERHLVAQAAGRLDVAVPPLVSAWGRRPSYSQTTGEVGGDARPAAANPHGAEGMS